MSSIKVPKSVTRVLSSNESVIDKHTSFEKDMYATNKRVLLFQKPNWYLLLFLFGILPGIIGMLLVSKSLSGSAEYSRISAVGQKSLRSPRLQIMGLVLFLILFMMGLYFINLISSSHYRAISDTWWIGLFPIALGLFFGVLLGLVKSPCWQIELATLPGKLPEKWRVYTIKERVKSKAAEKSRAKAAAFFTNVKAMVTKGE